MKHKHHIIPRHMGGTDSPENLYECSVEEHAELHFALYLEHGRWEDYMAALGLAGIIGHEEVRRKVISEANKGKTPWNKGKTGVQSCPEVGKANSKRVWTDEMRKKVSESMKGKNKGRKRPDLAEKNRKRKGTYIQRDELGRFV